MSDKSDKEKKKPPEPDLSTPHPDDRELFLWFESLFQEGERAAYVVVNHVFGKYNKTIGEVVKKKDFKDGVIPTREELVIVSNEFLEAMQIETDAARREMSFRLYAHNRQKSATLFDSRPVTLTPKRVIFKADGDDDEDDDSPEGIRIRRAKSESEHVGILLADLRWHSEQNAAILGGFAQLVTGENKDLRGQVKDLFGALMQALREKNEAENNSLDREFLREEKKFGLEVKKRGVNLLGGLLPDFFRKVTNGAVNVPGGRTTESMAIESVMDSLTDAEKAVVFGEWTDEGKRTKPGILTEAQVLLIRAVFREEAQPSELDRLIVGPDQIEMQQFMKIAEQGVDVDKFTPLVGLLKDRKDKLVGTAKQNGVAGGHPASAPSVPRVPPPTAKTEG